MLSLPFRAKYPKRRIQVILFNLLYFDYLPWVVVSILYTPYGVQFSCVGYVHGERGVLGLEKVQTVVRPLRSGGCRNTRWLKRGAVLLLYCMLGRCQRLFIHYSHITIVYIQISSWNFSKQKIYDICNTENSGLNSDFKGLFLGIYEKRGL